MSVTSLVKVPKEQIKGVECKHVCYQAANDGSANDLLLIKEVIHTKDGALIPNLRMIENFQRPFYITKKPYQNHKDKKEHEELEKLDCFFSTEVELAKNIQLRLGYRFPNPKSRLSEVCKNPYVYNADIRTPTIIKHLYAKNNPNIVSRNKVAVLDTERDVTFGTNDTILCTVTCQDKVYVGIVKWYADRIPNLVDTLRKKYEEYLSSVTIKDGKDKTTGETKYRTIDIAHDRAPNIEFIVKETPGQIIKAIVLKAHELRPDFLAIWNMNYDIPEMLKALKKDGIPPEDVFCDPCVPEQYRNVWYKEGKAQRETNSKKISQHPADLWHVLYCQAGFYVIDAMCLFKKIRTAKGNEPDYNLDGVLGRHLGISKLKFKEADHLKRLKWHRFMQDNYPAEYVIYNIFDCISIELLDEKTNDMGLTISSLAEVSGFDIFPSIPKRLVDVLHFFYEEYGRVAGTAGSDVVGELDLEVISIAGWIKCISNHGPILCNH